MSSTPIEDYLDELLLRSTADARTTRRLLDEAGDHLYELAAELHTAGLTREQAEVEAVRRFGPTGPIVRVSAHGGLRNLALDTLAAAVFLAGCGLVAVGLSGFVALVMNVWVGPNFVGGQTVFPGPHPSVQEAADDAVVLRVIAGLVGALLLLAYLGWRRYSPARTVLPAGLVDALGAAAFAAGTAGLLIAGVDQAAQTGSPGVGFALSGALIALPATVYFCVRAARALVSPAGSQPTPALGGGGR